ncbi:hypothetical protein BH23GEM7_BH23GEM7_25210 [soil metagenome]
MIHLRTLGSLDLRAEDGRELRSVLAQPKRFALLAYLAAASPASFHRRDSLLALFWPESSEDAARAALRTALSVLRRSLGEEVVIGRGSEEIGINSERLWCDVPAFEQALAAGTLEQGLELYRGDLLTGFYVEDAPAFERWLEERRAELRQKAAEAAWRLAERAEEKGNPAAVQWAQQGVVLAPDDEAALRRLLALLDRGGDRAGALRAYEEFAQRLREQYEAEPSPETVALIQSIRVRERVQQQHLPCTPVEPVKEPAAEPIATAPHALRMPDGEAAEPLVPPKHAVPHEPKTRPSPPFAGNGRRTMRPGRVLTVAAAVLLGVLGTLYVTTSPSDARQGIASPGTSGSDSAAVSLSSIVVLPFVDMSAEGDQEYFGDGIAEELINVLTRVEGLQVVARTSSFAFKGSSTDVREIGRRLGVRTVLEGSVRKSANRVRITAQLISAENGYHLWSETYEREVSDIFAIQDEISRAIANALTGSFLGTGQLRGAKHVTENLAAYDHYLRGLHFLNQGSVEALQKAAGYFEQAIAADSGYALAYAGLSDAYIQFPTLGVMPATEAHARARTAARRALEMDGTLAEAHAVLARVQLEGDWDFRGAGRSYQRAIELNPHFATRFRYPFYLVTVGQLDEAIEVMQQTVALDPISVTARSRLGLILYFDGKYDQAVEQLRRALELAPADPFAHWYLGLIYIQQRRFDEGIEALQTAVTLSGGSPLVRATLGCAYARAGRRQEALRIRDELLSRESQLYLRPQGMVFLLSDLGERDEAFRWLEATIADRSLLPFVLASEPLLDPLRSDPRFARLLTKAGLD